MNHETKRAFFNIIRGQGRGVVIERIRYHTEQLPYGDYTTYTYLRTIGRYTNLYQAGCAAFIPSRREPHPRAVQRVERKNRGTHRSQSSACYTGHDTATA